MFFSDTLLKRYTPPTCTLEIWGKRSPLSLWAERNLLNEVRFKLHFDDPKIPEENQITVKGDHPELQILCDVVTTYVQNLLRIPCTRLNLSTVEMISPVVAKEEGRNITSVTEKSQNQLTGNSQPIISSIPYLKPKGLLSHELYFGNLTTSPEVTRIELSVSQLFDLANALDEYSGQTEILPHLKPAQSRGTIFAWGTSAAVALLAVGITAIGVKVFHSTHNQIAENKLDSQGGKKTLQDILPPVPPAPGDGLTPSPVLPQTLAKQPILAPPPGVQPSPSPARNPSVQVIVPPQRVVPPIPVVPPAPERTTIIVTPQSPKNAPPPAVSLSQLPPPKQANPYPLISNESPSAIAPTLPTLPSFSSSSSVAGLEATQEQDSNLVGLNPSATSRRKTTSSNNTLLDTIPQVAEVREYFQEKWQPPKSLRQTLEYRLVLGNDGSLARIIPLGNAAKLYIDQTNMPLLGEPFVSPPEIVEKPQIRLVLTPDGKVKTFLEE